MITCFLQALTQEAPLQNCSQNIQFHFHMYPLRYHQRQQRPFMYQMFLQTHEVAQMPLVVPVLALMLQPLLSIQVPMPMGNPRRRTYSKMGLAMLLCPPAMLTSSHGLTECTRGAGS